MNYEDLIFEKIKHIDDDGVEFWYARELQEILGYKEWRNFNNVIDKAKLACTTSGNVENSHFVDVNKMVDMYREVPEISLKYRNLYENYLTFGAMGCSIINTASY